MNIFYGNMETFCLFIWLLLEVNLENQNLRKSKFPGRDPRKYRMEERERRH